MRKFITNNVEAIRGISQVRINVFAIDTYARSTCDCLRLLSSGLRDLATSALFVHRRWQLVPSVVQPVGFTTGTGRRQAMQPSMQRMPARIG